MNLQDCIHTACLLEATARKPGNVHPGASFADLAYNDFVVSAAAVAPILARSAELGVGRAIRDAIRATAETAGHNTNLGIVLLLAPLAAVPAGQTLRTGISAILSNLNSRDAELAYQAIRTANPGGMGEVDDQDLTDAPTGTLLDVMRLASDRDQVANQYATDFEAVLEFGVPFLSACHDFSVNWEDSIVELYLRLMTKYPDSLIARKCGQGEADESASRAKSVLDSGWPQTSAGNAKLADFDSWLRAKNNQRNPGTTADLVTASLFAALRGTVIESPSVSLVRKHANRK